MDLIRFDWASKRLLRQKANFVVLEGLLSVLLNDKIKIVRMLESEGNKENADDTCALHEVQSKFNRLDMLAENNRGELVIIDVQNYRELDYFHKMLYGVSKVITEYIHQKEAYSEIKKVYSVNVLYFELGQGKDYLYHGYTDFRGVFVKDQLRLSVRQQEQFRCAAAGDIFPEYYILRVDEFNKVAVTPLDEWFLFLKTGEISDNATAPGLPEAKERLRRDKMTKEEQCEYDAHIENLRYQRSVIQTCIIEGKAEGLIEGKAEGWIEGKAEGLIEGEAIGLEKGRAEEREKAKQEREQTVINIFKAGHSIDVIANFTGLTPQQITEILKQNGLI
jgi:predicted transposase/invertase (TIGR01784 family)